ncbi:DUF2092 domain-containing protein [Streptomyces sp. MST-110588]|uniref:LolA family protein n=1 Tax=Streptomyces sp. MST-110588 TaxID=2833628 RepID=UPI001F5C13E6|nr:DUF2092 domain-containing protein [Streptomyces sp. MST-110588]UNO41290.1 DUF2092 domain-containing protein [Streptomyces sp. MST-110588]
MPRNQPTQVTDEWDGGRSAKRRKTTRYAVPVAVAGVAAASIGLVPAFAGSGSPDLPKISAQDLIAKVAKSDVQRLSGTVRISTDLGLPALPGADGNGGGLFGGGGHGGEKGGDAKASASPDGKLRELASGSHTLRVAADGPDRQRVTLVEKAAEYSLIHNGDDVWAYDSGSNSVFHGKAPAASSKDLKNRKDLEGHKGLKDHEGLKDLKGLENATPQDLARQVLKAAGETTSVTVDGTAKVAGRDAYQLLIKPKQSGSTVGSIRIAVDAGNGVPLKFTLTPKSGGAAAIDAGFTSVDFSRPGADTFRFTPPKGAKVEEKNLDRARHHRDFKGLEGFKGLNGADGDSATPQGARGGPSGMKVIGKGWTSIVTVKGSGSGVPSAKEEGPAGEAGKFLDSIGEKVNGSFGSGRLFSTRLVNALITDNGTVYAGAVDKQTLIDAANAAK